MLFLSIQTRRGYEQINVENSGALASTFFIFFPSLSFLMQYLGLNPGLHTSCTSTQLHAQSLNFCFIFFCRGAGTGN